MPTQAQAHYTPRSPAPASCSTMRTSTSAATKFRDPIASMAAPALSASLSIRRLRSSGSVKGGQSPAMFPSAASGRKSGGDAFEPAEPTSPKVTCIGQVRVKKRRKKKKKKKVALARTRSRRMEEGDLSFRSEEVAAVGGDRANQRWVHLHLGNICEAVRSLGSELNCLSPCWRTSRCHPKAKDKRPCDGARTGSCSAAFARWLMAVHEDDEEKETPTGEENAAASREEAAEVCVPPPNALLLMRCRSGPVRMAALESRFWGGEIDGDDEEEEDEETTRIAEPVEEVPSLQEEAGGDREQPEADVGIASRTETADERRHEEEKKKATDTRRRRHSFSAEKQARPPSSEGKRRSSFSSYVEQPKRSSVYLESSQRAPPDAGPPLAKQLPGCLLLMMYEPKLSMEVSRETWVCSTDFVRPGAAQPQLHRHGDGVGAPDTAAAPEVVDRSNGEVGDGEEKERKAAEPEPPSTTPEKAGGFGPLVLTRCKSEPVKASAKFSPELGFWMSRHLPVSAAAEVGF